MSRLEHRRHGISIDFAVSCVLSLQVASYNHGFVLAGQDVAGFGLSRLIYYVVESPACPLEVETSCIQALACSKNPACRRDHVPGTFGIIESTPLFACLKLQNADLVPHLVKPCR
jgi:hypothetical protein